MSFRSKYLAEEIEQILDKANNSKLVSPAPKTSNMTQEVGVDADGKLYAPSVSDVAMEAAIESYLAENPIESSGITRIESTDQTNLTNLRDLTSGTYILKGYFRPYAGASNILTFASDLLVNVVTKTAGTSVQVFYPVNNLVQFLEITDSTYTRTDIKLNEMLEHIGTLNNLTTTAKTDLVTAINEVKQFVNSTLPAVTTADKGKFLRVNASGKWAAETVTDANGGAF